MDRLTGPGWVGLHIVVAVCVLLFVPLGLSALRRRRRADSRPATPGHERSAAAAGLAAERAGIALLGFPAGVLGLTAAHFHVAGFGALLLLALAEARFRLLAPAGVAVVGAGFLIGGTAGDVVELFFDGVATA